MQHTAMSLPCPAGAALLRPASRFRARPAFTSAAARPAQRRAQQPARLVRAAAESSPEQTLAETAALDQLIDMLLVRCPALWSMRAESNASLYTSPQACRR